jgi:hypothetical protein
MPDGPVFPRGPGGHENRPESVQGQARAEIGKLPAAIEDALLADQMALFAHCFAFQGRQVFWINDGKVHLARGLGLLAGGVPPHVQLAWSMAAFAANAGLIEHRRLEAVPESGARSGAISVAKETIGRGRPTGQEVDPETGGSVPD